MLDLWGNILTFFNSITSTVGMVLIFESFFHRRCRGWRFLAVLVVWYGVSTCLQYGVGFREVPLLLAVSNCLISAVLILFLYRARWDRAFFVAVTGYALCSAPNYWSDRLAMWIFGLSHDELIWNIPLYSVVFIGKSLASLVVGWLIWRLHKPLPKSDAELRVWVPLVTIFPLMTLVAFYGLYSDRNQWKGTSQWQSTLLVLEIVDVVALLLFDRLERSTMDREALVAAHERARVQDENLQALSQAYSTQRKLTHDFRACLTTLSGLLEQGNVAQAQSYLEELKIRQTERILLVNTHNAAIDAVLNQKGYAAQKRGVDLRFRVNDLSALGLNAVDATLVLGNLLDNAMEACAALPERDRWVEAEILYHAKGDPPSLSISVVNPSRPVTVEDGQFVTTKAEPMLHGFGLQNVREILDRYGAEYTCFYENGRFVFSADWPDRPPEAGAEKSLRSRHHFPHS